jgi:hypothetical protein
MVVKIVAVLVRYFEFDHDRICVKESDTPVRSVVKNTFVEHILEEHDDAPVSPANSIIGIRYVGRIGIVDDHSKKDGTRTDWRRCYYLPYTTSDPGTNDSANCFVFSIIARPEKKTTTKGK